VLNEDFSLIYDQFSSEKVSPEDCDLLLSQGWRHFGQLFYRYNLAFSVSEIRFVVPLRIRLENFKFSKSQRRILRKNSDLNFSIQPISFDEQKHQLFERHKERFVESKPNSLYDFLDEDAANTPCESFEISVFDSQRNLMAVSFFDCGSESISAIYGMFEPEAEKRSLGIYTMLLEIQHAIESGKEFYYHGYAYEGDSFYDYKKRFSAIERYDWKGNWVEFSEDSKKDFLG